MFDPSLFRGVTVLVTGGAGFLGSTIAKRLLKEGARVIVVDNLLTGKKANLEEVLDQEQFVFVEGDCNSRDQIAEVFLTYRPTYVYHYAAVVGVRRTVEHPLWVLGDIQGIRNIYELAALSGVKKVVFASSSEAYGEPVTLPSFEDGVLNAKEPYALVKLIGEQYGQAMRKKSGLRFTALRNFNVYGPGQEASDYGFVAGIFLRQVLQNQPPTIFGDGLQTRNFVYVDDNVELALRAMLMESADGEVINIGSGKPTTIKELAELAIHLSGKSLEPSYLPARTQGEIRYRHPSVEKCERLLGYLPQISLEEGLRKTYAWYQTHFAAQEQMTVS